MTLVAASLWSVPAADRPRTADRLTAAGLRRWHWDVSDGRFAAPGGFDPAEAALLGERTGLPGEAHLMVADPLSRVDAWAAVCDRVIVHIEAEGWRAALRRVADLGARPGLALSPGSPAVLPDGLPPGTAVLVMAIEPGRAGAAFRPSTLTRLDALHGAAELGVDGGVTPELAHRCAAHGATWVVSGGSLCHAPDAREWLDSVR